VISRYRRRGASSDPLQGYVGWHSYVRWSQSVAEVVRRGNAQLIIVPIGYDDTDDKSYSLFIVLDMEPGGDRNLSFCIVEYDGETDSEYTYWSGRETRFICGDDRALVKAALLCAVEHLLNTVQPARVHMCTIDADSPEKAQVKNFEIVRVFEICGYAVHTADPYHGQQVWWMERVVPSTVRE
jgi:hypothetical protein